MAGSRGAYGAAALLLLLLVRPSSAFIRAQGGRFVDEQCRDFTFVGVNTWRMLEAAAGTVGVKVNGISPAEWLLQTAAANNISVVRMLATGVTDELPLQPTQGQYNQVALKALDQVLDWAARNKVMVTLILARLWNGPDNLASYASFTSTPIDDFFTSPKARAQFADHITFMANRTNTVNGKKYSEDGTIFSWELMNEPRTFYNNTKCQQNDGMKCADDLNSWINEMAGVLKKSVPNQMVSIGYEGFFGSNSTLKDANPPGGWATSTGQDFERNFASKSLDYAEMHMWPDNWKTAGDPGFINKWITAHQQAAEKLGKPLIFEEFGKNTTEPFNDNAPDMGTRTQVFNEVFKTLDDDLAKGGIMRGASYWMWDPILQSTNSPGYTDFGQDQVPPTSSVFKNIVVPSARSAAKVAGGPVQGCTPGAAPPVSTAPVAAAAGGRKLRATGV